MNKHVVDEARWARRRRPFFFCYDCVTLPCTTCIPILLVLLFFILLAAKLDGSGLSWFAVFAPFWVILAIGILGCCCALFVSFNYDSTTGLLTKTFVGDAARTEAFWSTFCCPANRSFNLTGGMVTARAVYTAWYVLLLGSLPLLAALKLNGTLDWGWGLTLLPLWLAMGSICCAPAMYNDETSELGMIGFIGLAGLSVWVLPVLIMVAVYADGGDMELRLAFIPFWILDIVMVVAGIAMCVVGCGETHGDPMARRLMCAMFTTGLLATGGIITTEFLLVARSEGGLAGASWMQLFTPLFIFILMIWIGSTCVTAAACVNITVTGRRWYARLMWGRVEIDDPTRRAEGGGGLMDTSGLNMSDPTTRALVHEVNFGSGRIV